MLPVWQIVLIFVFVGIIIGLAYWFATKDNSKDTAVVAGATPPPLMVKGMSLAIDSPGPTACLPEDMIKDSLMAGSRPVVMTDASTRVLMELIRGDPAYNMYTLEPPKTGDYAAYWLSKTIGANGAAAFARTLGLENTAASKKQFVVYMEFPSEFKGETNGLDEFLKDKGFLFAGSSRSLKPSTVRSHYMKSCRPPKADITVRCKGSYSSCEYIADGSVPATTSAGETLEVLSSCSPAFYASRLLLWLPDKADRASYATCYASALTSTPPAATTTMAATQPATSKPAESLQLRFSSPCTKPTVVESGAAKGILNAAILAAAGNFVHLSMYNGLPTESPDLANDFFLQLKLEIKSAGAIGAVMDAIAQSVKSSGRDIVVGELEGRSVGQQFIDAYGEGYLIFIFYESSSVQFDNLQELVSVDVQQAFRAYTLTPGPVLTPPCFTQPATTRPATTRPATTTPATTTPATTTPATTTPATTTPATTTPATTTQSPSSQVVTTQRPIECAGTDVSIKGKCYVHDETLNAGGAYSCSTDLDCSGLRTCSSYGWCGEGPAYTRPA